MRLPLGSVHSRFESEFTMTTPLRPPAFGQLAYEYCGIKLPLTVLRSAAGYYIGTYDDGPCSRESNEYFRTKEIARAALASGKWTQKMCP